MFGFKIGNATVVCVGIVGVDLCSVFSSWGLVEQDLPHALDDADYMEYFKIVQ